MLVEADPNCHEYKSIKSFQRRSQRAERAVRVKGGFFCERGVGKGG